MLSFQNCSDLFLGPYVDNKWIVAKVEHRFGTWSAQPGQEVATALGSPYEQLAARIDIG